MQSLDNIYVRTSGGMAPVSQFVTLSKTYGSESLTRFNLFSAINVQGMPADGYSSGDVINAVKEVAAESLPTGYGYEFSGMTREEAQMAGSHDTVMIYCICVLFIYLILCGLYESLFVPLSVIMSVPFGLAGSFLFARLWGLENNIYLQTGLIMLIGLLSKTAILNRICRRTPQERNVAHAGCHQCGIGTIPSYTDDCAYDDIRYAASDVCIRCRSKRQPVARCGRRRRSADRYRGSVVHNSGILHNVPVC